jgi:hypothetical protein
MIAMKKITRKNCPAALISHQRYGAILFLWKRLEVSRGSLGVGAAR